MKDIIIRKLKKKDIPAAAQLAKSMWLDHSVHHPELYKSSEFKAYDAEKYYQSGLYSKKDIILVAESKTEVIATVRGHIEKWPSWYQFRHIMYIDDVVVDHKHRRQGIATALIHELIQLGEKRGITSFYSKVYNFNKHSQALFEKCNFENKYSYYFKIK